ncbi:hypothetical protein K9N68_30550 [Kovacikia minuta CCNUW1]|uniref:hypothetical protein n=1 Tax=Kovacikia minuta TaxID=2931930 RepID=UPI001CCE5890|nr:hypothetical protein [Kovacikia minuta]UBF25836.1 hypothetical protein K9N68_30550 [Kovacikia minuta CCNUW1]
MFSDTTAVLLGWSCAAPEQVLFQAGNLGDEDWQVWAVDAKGQTFPAETDRPITFGQVVHNVWMGPQA